MATAPATKAKKAYSDFQKSLPELRRAYSGCRARLAEIDDRARYLRRAPLNQDDLRASLATAIEARQHQILGSEALAEQIVYLRNAGRVFLDEQPDQAEAAALAPFAVSTPSADDIAALVALAGDAGDIADKLLSNARLPDEQPGPALSDRRKELAALESERLDLEAEREELERVLRLAGEDLGAWQNQRPQPPKAGDTRIGASGEREVYLDAMPNVSPSLAATSAGGWISESAAKRARVPFPAAAIGAVEGFNAGVPLPDEIEA